MKGRDSSFHPDLICLAGHIASGRNRVSKRPVCHAGQPYWMGCVAMLENVTALLWGLAEISLFSAATSPFLQLQQQNRHLWNGLIELYPQKASLSVFLVTESLKWA